MIKKFESKIKFNQNDWKETEQCNWLDEWNEIKDNNIKKENSTIKKMIETNICRRCLKMKNEKKNQIWENFESLII